MAVDMCISLHHLRFLVSFLTSVRMRRRVTVLALCMCVCYNSSVNIVHFYSPSKVRMAVV